MRRSDPADDALRAWAPATALAAVALAACALFAIRPALRDADAADARADRHRAFAAAVGRRGATTAELSLLRDRLVDELAERASSAPRGPLRREHASGGFDELWSRVRDLERSAVVEGIVLERGPGGLVLRLEARDLVASGEGRGEDAR